MPGILDTSNTHFTDTGATRIELENEDLVATVLDGFFSYNANTALQKQITLAGLVRETQTLGVMPEIANNYTVTGFENATVASIDLVGMSIDITGISGGIEGRVVIIENIDTVNWWISIPDQSLSSIDVNRIITPDNFTMTLRNGINTILRYDGITQRWRVLARPISAADAGDMESNSSTSAFVPASLTHRAPGAAKVWVVGTPNSTTIITSYNVTSLGDTATGQQTVTIADDFSSSAYCVLVGVDDTLGTLTVVNGTSVSSRAAGSYIMNSVLEAASGDDPLTAWHSVAFGDQ